MCFLKFSFGISFKHLSLSVIAWTSGSHIFAFLPTVLLGWAAAALSVLKLLIFSDVTSEEGRSGDLLLRGDLHFDLSYDFSCSNFLKPAPVFLLMKSSRVISRLLSPYRCI